MGKNSALQFGAREARAPFILFTDADVVLGPEVVAEAVAKMESEGLDHLGGHFFVDCHTLAEEVCAPFLVLSSSIALCGTARSLGAATGAFNLVRAEAYRRWGCHEPIKGEIVDDVALARHLKRRGAATRFLRMDDRVRVRLFIGFSGYLKAVARSSVPFLNIGALPVALLALGLVALTMLTLGGVCLPALALLSPDGSVLLPDWVRWLAPAPYALGLLAMFMAPAFDNARWIFRLFFPVASMLLACGVLQACLRRSVGSPVTWRGRRYGRTTSSA